MKNGTLILNILVAVALLGVCEVVLSTDGPAIETVLQSVPTLEGVDTHVSTEEIAELSKYEEGAARVMDREMERINEMRRSDRIAAFRVLFHELTKPTQSKAHNFFFFATLNRALALDTILTRTAGANLDKDNLRMVIFMDAIARARRWYREDVAFLAEAGPRTALDQGLPMATFGLDYATGITRYARMAPSHEAQATILVFQLTMLFKDLNASVLRRDLADALLYPLGTYLLELKAHHFGDAEDWITIENQALKNFDLWTRELKNQNPASKERMRTDLKIEFTRSKK